MDVTGSLSGAVLRNSLVPDTLLDLLSLKIYENQAFKSTLLSHMTEKCIHKSLEITKKKHKRILGNKCMMIAFCNEILLLTILTDDLNGC